VQSRLLLLSLPLLLALSACGGGSGEPPAPDAAESDALPAPDAPPAPACGDGHVDVGEACDDGNEADSDGCVACAFATCGDGAVRTGVEDCDDGSPDCVACARCAGFADPATGHCYTRFTAAQSRSNAAATCAVGGARLATIETEAEWLAIAPFWTAPFDTAWIGLIRNGDGVDSWLWETGALLDAPRWNGGEPNDANGNEDCVEVSGAEGRWNDLACDQTRQALCEREPWLVDPASHHAYRLMYRLRTWQEALNDCVALGGSLAAITTDAEQALLAPLATRDAWIGAFQGPNGGPFLWSTAEPFDYAHWGEGQPDDFGGTEDCASLRADGTWNDLGCAARLPYLCELD
jgi:cysteine-rich repeat protein